MNLIFFAVFAILAALLIAQVVCVVIAVNKKSNNKTGCQENKYSADVLKHGEKSMQAVITGKIKKQLIGNDASLYDSAKALRQYSEFMEKSTIYRKILSIKGSRYHG